MSDQALQLIAENKRTQNSFLDLGNCGLKEIPSEIGELSWLESLSLASRWWEWDGKRWEEKRSRNSGEGNTRLMDISPLAGLSGLQFSRMPMPRSVNLRRKTSILCGPSRRS
ncbi:MAG: hypothetical protein P8X96_06100 [Desulfobacteraceae bacterium]